MKRAISMRSALADPNLLGNALVGDSWATWRIFLIACMGEALTAAEREVFQRFTGRDREPGERVEEALFLIGRRGGKDRAASVLATYLAALVDWSGTLARGERGLVVDIAPGIQQAAIQRGYVEGCFDSSPLLSSLVVSRSADAIVLNNNISIEVRSASFRRLRGVTAVAVIASEASFWFDEGSSNSDEEILTAIRPSLATTGGPLVLITTPHSQRGVVWDLYRRHYGPQGDPLILVAQGTSRDFNPTLSQKVIDRAMERDAAAASAEFLAQFRTDIESFVSRAAVDACVINDRIELPPAKGVGYSAFVDPSGGSADSMTVAIAHQQTIGDHAVVAVDAIRERRPPFSPDDVVGEFAGLLRSYGIASVTGDRYAGEWPRERFRVHGVEYVVSERTKSQLYVELLPLLNAGRVELLDNPRLIAQLCGLERRTARGGRDSIDHAPRAHDDLINSAAGAIVAASAGVEVVDSVGLLAALKAARGRGPCLGLMGPFATPMSSPTSAPSPSPMSFSQRWPSSQIR